jgi:hypothetical protein
MKVAEAISQVESRLAQLETNNRDGVLRPWEPNACPDALQHWSLVQQRIALKTNPHGRACCANLDLDPPERTPAQKQATGRAQAFQKASKTPTGGDSGCRIRVIKGWDAHRHPLRVSGPLTAFQPTARTRAYDTFAPMKGINL